MEIVRGKHIWTEDDATPGTDGHETLSAAWRRLFGTEFDSTAATAKEDCGDHDLLLMPNGKVVMLSYPGNNGIYEGRG